MFTADPALYQRYRGAVSVEQGNQVVVTKADGSIVPAPTFGAALIGQRLESLYDLTSALAQTLRGIVASAASDKGPAVGQALDDLTSAVRQAFAQAGIQVPVTKQFLSPLLEAEVLRTLLQVAPRDPLGQGGRGADQGPAPAAAELGGLAR